MSLRNFIEAIESIEMNGSLSLSEIAINEHIVELENCLSLMISEFKSNRIERVVSLALEIARNANEIFLNIAKTAK